MLENGLTYQQLAMSLEDAQWIAAQQFTVVEVARLFRVPPTMLQDSGATPATATPPSWAAKARALQPAAVASAMWEAEITRQLLDHSRRRYLAEHSVEGLLRGNPEARADFYGKAINDGWMTTDEVPPGEPTCHRGTGRCRNSRPYMTACAPESARHSRAQADL